MIRFSCIFLFFTVAMCFCLKAQSQSINDLSNKRKAIEENISKLNNLIEETSKTKSLTVNNLALIKNRIKLKNDLVKQIENEIDFLNSKIIYSQHEIDSLTLQLDDRREELAFILRTKFRNRDKVELIMFVLSSQSFNQAYTRVKFYKNLISYQEKRIDELKQLISSINVSKLNLQNNHKLLRVKQIEKESEIQKLNEESKVYENQVISIRKKESSLRKDLANELKRSEAIANQIKRLIEEEARRKSKGDTKANNINYALSKQFKDNFGKLPAPVKNGVITSTFGESNHPYLKGVKVKNNGVDITVSKNSDVYCIFDGEVRKIFNVPLSGIAVIVRHGNYLTVYSNLSNLVVKVGDKLRTGQKLGNVARTDGKVGILHFEVWNERSPENPIHWIPSYKGH